MQANFLHNMVQKIEKVYQPESKISYNESILIRRARKLLAQATNSTISNPLSEFAIRVSNKPLKKNTKSSNVLNTSHSHERSISQCKSNKSGEISPIIKYNNIKNIVIKNKQRSQTPSERPFQIDNNPKESKIEKTIKKKIKTAIELTDRKKKLDSEISEQSFNNFNSAPLKKESKKNIDFNSTLNRFEIYNHKRNENIQKLRLKQESAQLIDYESMPKSTIIKGKRLYERTPEIIKKKKEDQEKLKEKIEQQKKIKEESEINLKYQSKKNNNLGKVEKERNYTQFYEDMITWKKKIKINNQKKELDLRKKELDQLTFNPNITNEFNKNFIRTKDKIEDRLNNWKTEVENRKKKLSKDLTPDFSPKICEKSKILAKNYKPKKKDLQNIEKSKNELNNENKDNKINLCNKIENENDIKKDHEINEKNLEEKSLNQNNEKLLDPNETSIHKKKKKISFNTMAEVYTPEETFKDESENKEDNDNDNDSMIL